VYSVVHPSYDLDGNMLHGPAGAPGQILGFKWNGENRLVAVTNGTTVVHNTYDSQGRRVRKLVTESGTPSKDIRWLYDNWNPSFEFDVLSMSNTKYYAWGLDLSQSMQGAGGVGGLLFVQENGNKNAATYDANGNISEYVDLAIGNVTAHLEYDAFGRVFASTGARPSAYGFSTKYEDAETGLLYYGFRFLAPEMGRWINRDPIGEQGGYNIYEAGNNNMFSHIDYFGLFAPSLPLAVPAPPPPGHPSRPRFDETVAYAHENNTTYTDAFREINSPLSNGITSFELTAFLGGEFTIIDWCGGDGNRYRTTFMGLCYGYDLGFNVTRSLLVTGIDLSCTNEAEVRSAFSGDTLDVGISGLGGVQQNSIGWSGLGSMRGNTPTGVNVVSAGVGVGGGPAISLCRSFQVGFAFIIERNSRDCCECASAN